MVLVVQLPKFRAITCALVLGSIVMCGCDRIGSAGNVTLLEMPGIEPQVFLRQSQVEGDKVEMVALLHGTLQLDGNCLAITEQESDKSFFPIWPPGFTANVLSGNHIEVYDTAGEPVGAVGDEITLGGGERETLQGSAPMIPKSAHETIENLCPGKYWIVGSVIARGWERE